MKQSLYMGCTASRHAQLGIHAVINARGGCAALNDNSSIEEIEMYRDARNIRERLAHRVRFYQFGSRCFRRHARQFHHLLAEVGE